MTPGRWYVEWLRPDHNKYIDWHIHGNYDNALTAHIKAIEWKRAFGGEWRITGIQNGEKVETPVDC